MVRFFTEIALLYRRHIIDAGKQPQALILLSFLITFLVIRAITYRIHNRQSQSQASQSQTSQSQTSQNQSSKSQNRHKFGFHDVVIGGTHIHHLVWGILLLLGVGYSAIAFHPMPSPEGLAMLFGIGAALTLDEFALWLQLKDVYWSRDGRWSVDAVIVVAALVALNLLGWSFIQASGREILRLMQMR